MTHSCTLKFRNDQDRLMTASLFWDKQYNKEHAIYVLGNKDKEVDGKVLPSLYRLYITMSDITEYNFANEYFESYQHWQAICEEEWFKPLITRWRKELELKIKAEALKEIIAQSAAEDPKKRLEASKYIYEKVFVEGNRGRPSKKQIKEEAVRRAQEEQLITEDWNRLIN